MRLELTRLVKDGEGRALIPLRAGPVVFSEEPLGNDARELLGVSARIISCWRCCETASHVRATTATTL